MFKPRIIFPEKIWEKILQDSTYYEIKELAEIIQDPKLDEYLERKKNEETSYLKYFLENYGYDPENYENIDELIINDDEELLPLPELGLMQNLENLQLVNDNIKELPESLVDLKNLSFVDVSHNNLVKLPEFKKSGLTVRVYSNRIKEFPNDNIIYYPGRDRQARDTISVSMPGEKDEKDYFSILPPENKLNIFLFVPDEDLDTFCDISETFAEFCEDDNNWKARWENVHGKEKLLSNKSWRYNYEKCNDLQLLKNLINQPDLTNEELLEKKLIKIFTKRLTKIPDVIGCLENVKNISFFNNNLSDLPDTMKNLVNLEKIVLTMNRFKKVPLVLLKLPKLKEIWLHANPIENYEIPGWSWRNNNNLLIREAKR